MIRGRGGFSTEEVERLLRETQDAHRQWLLELPQQHPLEDLKYEVYLLKGEGETGPGVDCIENGNRVLSLVISKDEIR